MIRKAFSLVELIISVLLLGVIVTFLYTTVSNLERTNRIFASNEKKLSQKEKILDLLADDIFSSNTLTIQGLEHSLISMQTQNSLFDITHPYVSWLVSKEKNTLLRFESIKEFKNLNTQNADYYHISKVGEDCEIFKIYQSKDQKYIMIHVQFKDQEALVYELSKPLQKKKQKAKVKQAAQVGGQNPGFNPNTPATPTGTPNSGTVKIPTKTPGNSPLGGSL